MTQTRPKERTYESSPTQSSGRRRTYAALLLGTSVFAAAVIFAACGGGGDSGGSNETVAIGPNGAIPANIGKNDSANITGAGATFPAPIYQAWFDDYANKVAKGVRINYQSIGSGGGIQQFTEKTVDFGASDAPMTDAEMQKASDVQHIPMVVGAVVMTYNLDGLTKPLQLDGDTVARIYLGTIKKWSDPAITGQNPGAKLPDKDIQVVSRSDGSGTSFVFTDWLSKMNTDWKSKVGASKNPSWPVGQGGKGNEGVTAAVKQTPNAIGYVELNYAIANKLAFADIKNKAGKYVTPTVDSTSQAAAGVTMPDDYRVSITNADGDKAYPVASFTYLLVHKNTDSCSREKPLVNALWWIFHDSSAAKTATELNYAPLPGPTLAKVDATLKSLQCEGTPILPQ